MVCVWEVDSGKILYKVCLTLFWSVRTCVDSFASQLPGHKGTVTAVDFHPKEPISAYMPILNLTVTDVLRISLDREQRWHDDLGRAGAWSCGVGLSSSCILARRGYRGYIFRQHTAYELSSILTFKLMAQREIYGIQCNMVVMWGVRDNLSKDGERRATTEKAHAHGLGNIGEGVFGAVNSLNVLLLEKSLDGLHISTLTSCVSAQDKNQPF
jgi:hypothetical protein